MYFTGREKPQSFHACVFEQARKALRRNSWEIGKHIYHYKALYYFITFFHHKKKKLLCLLYLNIIIYFIWIDHFHLLFSHSYSIILLLYDIFVVDLPWQLKAVDWIKKVPYLPLMCVFKVKVENPRREKKGF